MKTFVLCSGVLLAGIVSGGEPLELATLRQRYLVKTEPVHREMEAKLQPLREVYAAELETCAKRLELEGRDADAESVRAERDRVLEEIGIKPRAVAAANKAAPPIKPAVVRERIRSREELLAEAKQKLNARQYAVAERLVFRDLACDATKGGVFCLVKCSGAEEDGIFQFSDLKAEVRYLLEAGRAPLVFDSGAVDLKSVKPGRGVVPLPGSTWFEFDRREGGGMPLAARVRIQYFGVPVYEGEWTKNGTPARYDREGKFPWWQDREYSFVNINTATGEELAKLPGIKVALVNGIIEKRPFLTKEEIGKRVSGIGKKTYEQIEGKVGVR